MKFNKSHYQNPLKVLWINRSFQALSSIHKIVSIGYYLLNIRAVLTLGSPLYLNKDEWISLVIQ
eukprot:gene22999-29796_t